MLWKPTFQVAIPLHVRAGLTPPHILTLLILVFAVCFYFVFVFFFLSAAVFTADMKLSKREIYCRFIGVPIS